MNLADFDADFSARRENYAMHSHDRTMLAKFGFADPDRNNPDHDLICQYIAQTDAIKKIVAVMATDVPLKNNVGDTVAVDYDEFTVVVKGDLGFRTGCKPEYHLTKGDGPYKTTIGFLDIRVQVVRVLAATLTHRWHEYERKFVPREHEDREIADRSWATFIEVKAGKIAVNDVIRQMKLYEEYFFRPTGQHECAPKGAPRMILAAPWGITESEARDLKVSGIMFARIGDGFQTWKEQNAKTVGKPALEL